MNGENGSSELPFGAGVLLSGTVFFIVALVILLGFASFAAATLTAFLGWPAGPGLAVAAVGGILFISVIAVSFRWQHIVLRLAGRIAATFVGLLNYCVFAALLCWPAWWLVRLLHLPIRRPEIAVACFGTAVLVTIYGLINAARIRIRRFTVQLPNLPAAWQGRDVAVVTDIHIGNIRGAAFVQRIVRKLAEVAPAAVFISGDMFDGARVDIEASVAPWAGFRVPSGIYFVTGNHDEFSRPGSYTAALQRVGVTVLNNERQIVNDLQIAGLQDGAIHDPTIYRQLLARLHLDPARPSILLAHQPKLLGLAEEAGISLQVSGHTHSGQFWPWNLLVRRIFGRFAHGLHRHGKMQVVTSSGVGTWGPPMRVGTHSEIVVLRLERAVD